MSFKLIMNKYCPIFLFLAAILLFSLSGCLNARKTISPERDFSKAEMSQEAKSTFYYLQYQLLMNDNEEEKALLALQNATKYDPHPQLYLERIYYHMKNDNPDKAETAIQKALEMFPENKELNLTKVRLLFSRKKYNQALEILKNFIQKDGSNLEFKKLAGKLYLRQEKFTQALDILKSIPKDKKSAEIHFLLASAYSSLDNQQKAIDHLKISTSKNSSFVQAWAELAYQYELTKDYVAARETYEKLLNKGEKNPRILIRLVDLNLKLNNPQKAMQFVRQGPEDTKFRLEACSLFIQNNFYDKCQTILNNMQEDGLDSAQVLFYKAIIAHRKENNIPQALEYLNLIDQESKLYKRSLILKCKLLFAQDKKQEAKELAKKGQKLYPETEEFWLLECDYFQKKGNYSRAKKVLQNGLEFNSQNTSLLFQLGVVENNMGNTQKSLDYMQKVINIDSEHAKALNFLGYTLAEQGQNLERAKILVQKALQFEPENGYFLDSLAWVYYKSRKYDKAWETIQKAVQKENKDPIIWEHFGDIAKELDKRDKSKKAYEKALDLGTENPESIKSKLNKLK